MQELAGKAKDGLNCLFFCCRGLICGPKVHKFRGFATAQYRVFKSAAKMEPRLKLQAQNNLKAGGQGDLGSLSNSAKPACCFPQGSPFCTLLVWEFYTTAPCVSEPRKPSGLLAKQSQRDSLRSRRPPHKNPSGRLSQEFGDVLRGDMHPGHMQIGTGQ